MQKLIFRPEIQEWVAQRRIKSLQFSCYFLFARSFFCCLFVRHGRPASCTYRTSWRWPGPRWWRGPPVWCPSPRACSSRAAVADPGGSFLHSCHKDGGGVRAIILLRSQWLVEVLGHFDNVSCDGAIDIRISSDIDISHFLRLLNIPLTSRWSEREGGGVVHCMKIWNAHI